MSCERALPYFNNGVWYYNLLHFDVAHEILRDSLETIRQKDSPTFASKAADAEDLQRQRDMHFGDTCVFKRVTFYFRDAIPEYYRLQFRAVLK